MPERRKRPRKSAGTYVTVYDLSVNERIGYLIDISSSGMRLISESEFKPKTTLLLQIDLPANIEDRGQVLCKAEIIWCRKGKCVDCYESGLEITDISRYNQDTLEKWMASPVFGKTLKFTTEPVQKSK